MNMHAGGVARRLLELLEGPAREIPVREVRVGLVYTGVLLDDGHAGVALTLARPRGDCGPPLGHMQGMAGRAARDLLVGLVADSAVERAVGLATANALCNRPQPRHRDGDVRSLVALRADDRVVMVGHFRPLIDDIERATRALEIFELIDEPQGRVRPAREAAAALARCDVALITATTLVSATLDALLAAAAGCRLVVLLGASTPLLPEAFAGTPVTELCGVRVRKPAAVLRLLGEGAGMRDFKPHLDKVAVAL